MTDPMPGEHDDCDDPYCAALSPAAPSAPSEPTPEGIRADILDLESYAVTEDGRTIRYVLTGMRIPAGLTIGGFTFDPETGALGWTQNLRQPTGREIRDEMLAYPGLGPHARRNLEPGAPDPTFDAEALEPDVIALANHPLHDVWAAGGDASTSRDFRDKEGELDETGYIRYGLNVMRRTWAAVEAQVRAKVAAELRAAVAIADEEDVTDWQRGYRSCAQRVEQVAARIAEGKGDGCSHPEAAEVTTFADPDRRYRCTACGAEWSKKGRR